ncbi:flagellar biosynthesis protein FlhA [Myxococcota bacterium]|nr:flagellar biosynthesis protein FlhA [Myxococcota bacterium]
MSAPAPARRSYADSAWALVFIGVLLPIVVPLPPLVLDLALTLSIAVGLMVFLVTFYVREPMDFSVFPTLLLVTTLFRLGLNVASTRLILLRGHQGTESAGQLIHTFGEFMVGGDFVVGLITFVILVVINFAVITKGAGRIAEVTARFTLDAMPGKQMSIDADVNAGAITEAEARRRRKDVALEADFYGAMDGASKFIRGDAVAGLAVTAINIVGGLVIGVVQRGMPVGEAARNYTILTVGDGLVSQVPALIVSVAAGLLVTRVTGGGGLEQDLGQQLLGRPRALWVLSGVLLCFVAIPGFRLPFLGMAALAAGAAFSAERRAEAREAEERRAQSRGEKAPRKDSSPSQIEPGDVVAVETLEMEVGFDLLAMVDDRRGGDLTERIQKMRRQFARTHGVIVPPIHIRDNLSLKQTEYLVLLHGAEVARGELMVHHVLAMDPGGVRRPIQGIATKEPAFGLPALWITEGQRGAAIAAGYTVVDPVTVLSIHLSEVVKRHCAEFVGRQELQTLIDQLAKTHPKVVDELIPALLPLGTVLKVLRNLLRESVSIRNLLGILEALADHAPDTKDPEVLTEFARRRLARQISASVRDSDGQVRCVTLAPPVEESLRRALQPLPEGGQTLAIDPGLYQELVRRIAAEVEKTPQGDGSVVLLVGAPLRAPLRRLLERTLSAIPVISNLEIGSDVKVRRLATIRMP